MRVVGLMSGTSVDGIDVAVAEIQGRPAFGATVPDEPLRVEPLAFATVLWEPALRSAIFDLFVRPAPAADWCRLNVALAEYFAAATRTVLADAGLALETIDLIGSHGQTIWHEVVDGRVAGTLQIGPPAIIAAQTGITTVGNFRVADVAVGGQGAPLVSTYDWYLLRPPPVLHGIAGGWRAVQNIGGIANVTLLPPLDQPTDPLAFDTGPGNALIDWAASQATGGRLLYDVDGQLAAAGTVDQALLATWLADPYFDQPPPKSTGREYFSQALVQGWWEAAQSRGGSPDYFVATVSEFTAATIADAYARFAPGPIAQVVVGGGGARNPWLMARLTQQIEQRLGRPVEVCTQEALGINADAKEALAFALLAYLAIHGWPGNVPACTGASRPVVLGEIAPGDNYAQLLRMVSANEMR
jgi:anhydro-N-acetylmuramic acid kinase